MEEFKDFFEQFMEFYASSGSSRYPARLRTFKDPQQLPSVATNSSPAAESDESSGSEDSNLGGM